MRTIMFNRDVANGRFDLYDKHSTKGPSSTWHIKNDMMSIPQTECYIVAPMMMVKNDTAIIKKYKLVGHLEDDFRGAETYDPSGQMILGGRE